LAFAFTAVGSGVLGLIGRRSTRSRLLAGAGIVIGLGIVIATVISVAG